MRSSRKRARPSLSVYRTILRNSDMAGAFVGWSGVDDLLRRQRHVEGEGVFVGLRYFERGKLAVQQRRRHVVVGACGDARGQQLAAAMQDHQLQVRRTLAQHIAVAALQRRAGQHHAFTRGASLCQARTQRGQPALAVGIGQCLSGGHARHVLGRMEVIAVQVGGAARLRQQPADRALAAGADAHHDMDVSRDACRCLHRRDAPCCRRSPDRPSRPALPRCGRAARRSAARRPLRAAARSRRRSARPPPPWPRCRGRAC